MSGPLSRGTPTEEKLLSTLGLCARARKLVTGTPMVCEALRAGGKTPVLAVLEAEDTSAATHEKLVSKCTYYRTPPLQNPGEHRAPGSRRRKDGSRSRRRHHR